jgi:hypothetical protein
MLDFDILYDFLRSFPSSIIFLVLFILIPFAYLLKSLLACWLYNSRIASTTFIRAAREAGTIPAAIPKQKEKTTTPIRKDGSSKKISAP